MTTFEIAGDFIALHKLLKAAGLCGTGGAAKLAVEAGEVEVDGEVERSRGRKVRPGQVVRFRGEELRVQAM